MRHGHGDGEVTLGGRRVVVERPPVRTADGESEVPLETYELFAGSDQLGDVVLERMLSGVSTRQYRRVQEPGRRAGRGGCPRDLEVGGVENVRAAHPRPLRLLMPGRWPIRGWRC
ncbi:MAG: hypothetical protein JO039_21640 [Solirubrobacterales bacterium]|nr:hypothetical protein [Solirubrobacterales bacterium]